MIKKRVVLVLGAGASAPYGFPLGATLLDSIANERSEAFDRLMMELGFHESDVRDFQRDLAASSLASVDSFLESRQRFVEIGKACIAYHLLPHQKANPARVSEGDWCKYLFQLMHTPKWEDFANNQVRFITFNYDTSLERRLRFALIATHGMNEPDELDEVIRVVPVVHVHGHLRVRPIEEALTNALVDAGPSVKQVRDSMKSIRVVHEAQEAEAFREAWELLRKADTVVFLGFGFHEDNVKRLRLNDVCKAHCQVFGTVKGFTGSEIQTRINPLFSRVGGEDRTFRSAALPWHDGDALSFLRNHVYLFM